MKWRRWLWDKLMVVDSVDRLAFGSAPASPEPESVRQPNARRLTEKEVASLHQAWAILNKKAVECSSGAPYPAWKLLNAARGHIESQLDAVFADPGPVSSSSSPSADDTPPEAKP